MQETYDKNIIFDEIKKLSAASIIGIDGFHGSGKTELTDAIKAEMDPRDLSVINLDSFLNKDEEGKLLSPEDGYEGNLNWDNILSNIKSSKAQRLIVEGVFLRNVLKKLNLTPDLIIYVKRMGRSGWPEGYHIEDYRDGKEDHVSDLRSKLETDQYNYHIEWLPHENSDIIYMWDERNEKVSSMVSV